jgi:xanthine dehydrogenase accessory factor
MICSGEQTVFLYPLSVKDLPVIQKIVTALENNKTGILKITFSEIDFIASDIPEDDHVFNMRAETDFTYSERIGYKNHLYIIGGGHCALALSKLMSGMDFYIHLFEERENLNTMIENNFVHEKIIVNDYAGLADLITQDSFHTVGRPTSAGHDFYIVVMTVGYRTDDIAVRALANKKFRYLGVLGSESKMKQLFAEWRADRIPESWLSTIHAPIGIQIKSETPEEIAVSIAAEIIKIKNA